MKTHFLRPGDNTTSIKALEDIFNLNGKLQIAVAYFNSNRFADLIINRANANQHTYLLINTSDILRPQEIGDTEVAISNALVKILKHGYHNSFIHTKSLGLRAKGKYQNMHHKFILNEQSIIFGSVNLTDAALSKNYEFFIETDDVATHKSFTIEFSKMWDIASEIFTGNDGKIRSLMCPICEKNEGVDFESYGPFCSWCGYKFKIK